MANTDEKIILLILKGGENLLGLQTSRHEDDLKVKDIVAFAPNPNGQGVMTIPYLQFSVEAETEFSIKHDVRHLLTPNADLTKYYNENFGRVIVPETKLIHPTMLAVD